MASRKALTLDKKIELIKDNQNGNGLSVRVLADRYGISKSSVANILQRREEFISDYTSNCNKGIKRKDDDGQNEREVYI
jgi:transposase